jgi:invasion protein IalB
MQENCMDRPPRVRASTFRHGIPPRAMQVLVVACIAISAGSAIAQDVAAWRVECTGDGKSLDCRAVQQLIHSQTRQSLVLIMARGAKDPKAASITMVLPLGLNLTEPVQIRVDNHKPESHNIQTCTNTGCFLALTASPGLVAQMRGGRQLRITLQDANKKPVEMALPLLGFGIAFDKARG